MNKADETPKPTDVAGRIDGLVGRATRTVYTFLMVWGHRWRDGSRSGLLEAWLAAKGTWKDKGPQGKPCQVCDAKDTVIKMDGGLFCLNCGDRPPNK